MVAVKLNAMVPESLGVQGMRYEFLIAGRVTETVQAACPGFEFAPGPVAARPTRISTPRGSASG